MEWFRFYSNSINNPKVQRLPGDLFKFWVNCLCLAREHGGELPPLEDVAYRVRLDETTTEKHLNDLVSRRLLDQFRSKFTPHDWNEHQYASDSSTARSRKSRQEKALRYKQQPCNGDATLQQRSRIGIEQNRTEQKQNRADGATGDTPERKPPTKHGFTLELFEEAWKRHNKHRSQQPKQVIAQMLTTSDVDWTRFLKSHPPYCEYWANSGWQYCNLTLFDWIECGMPPPPNQGRDDGRSGFPKAPVYEDLSGT